MDLLRSLLPAVVCLTGLVAGCGGSARPTAAGTPAPTLAPTASAATPSPRAPTAPALTPTPYERMLLADGARGLWPLRDVKPRMRYGDTVADLRNPTSPAVDVDGAITPTAGPRLFGAPVRAAAFTSQGRLATRLTTGFTSQDAFTIEMWFRADGCTNSWGRAAGTEGADVRGREGVSMFFYPKVARQPCRLGVEIWHRNRYALGCSQGIEAPGGAWVHLAASYADGTLSCFRNGKLAERDRGRDVVFAQIAPFDIGSAGAGVAGNLSSGSLAQVAVYPRALPPARIAAHAAAAT